MPRRNQLLDGLRRTDDTFFALRRFRWKANLHEFLCNFAAIFNADAPSGRATARPARKPDKSENDE
jgi:hypothetical protein